MSTYYIKTYGCQYNEWDASRYSYVLQKLGLKESNEANADIVLALACSVRQTAIDRLLGKIRNWRKDNKRVVILGCILDENRNKLEERGAVIWEDFNITNLSNLLSVELNEKDVKKYLESSQISSNLVPIIRGCNNFCSYCVVPYTRGREVSKPVDEVLDNVRKIVEKGEKEIWLLGQNVNSYAFGFAELLKKIDALPGDFKLYFTSSHPKDMSDEIIGAIASFPKIAKRIHLPLQSGSNKILKAMNRPYTKEEYLNLVEKMKGRIPDLELTTDTIVGFPGETDEDFNETVRVFKKIKFFQSYNNKYSPRSGTTAYKLGDPIPWSVKQQRWRILNDMVNKK